MDTQRLDSTGYADGAEFESEAHVREYFTVEAMAEMFDDDADWTQDELDDMADYVIAEQLHCDFGRPAELAEDRPCGWRPSTTPGTCAVCGRRGWRSDWPGNDPANARATEVVLCANTSGELVCDDCGAIGDAAAE